MDDQRDKLYSPVAAWLSLATRTFGKTRLQLSANIYQLVSCS